MFQGLTPWGPIIFAAVVALGGALVVLRLTGRSGYAWAYVLLVIGLALAAFGTIATAMFAPAAILLVLALVVFVVTAMSGSDGSPLASLGLVTNDRMGRVHRTRSAGTAMLLLTLGVAVLISLASVLAPMTGGVLGAWWLLSIFVGLGHASARLLPLPVAIPVAAAAPPTAVCLSILAKAIAWPQVPATGDGFHILLVVFAATGALGAGLTVLLRRSSAAPRHEVP